MGMVDEDDDVLLVAQTGRPGGAVSPSDSMMSMGCARMTSGHVTPLCAFTGRAADGKHRQRESRAAPGVLPDVATAGVRSNEALNRTLDALIPVLIEAPAGEKSTASGRTVCRRPCR